MNQKTQANMNFSSVDLLIYMWNKKWILIIVTFLAGISSILISLQITDKYKSSVVLYPTTGASVSKALLSSNYTGRQSAYGFGEEEQAEQLIQIMKSELIQTRIVEKYNLMEHYGIDPATTKFPYTALAGEYNDNINFRRTDLGSVEITVMDADPDYAANIANDIAALIDTVYNDLKQQRARTAFELVAGEYEDAKRSFRMLQDSLQKVGGSMSTSLRKTGGSSMAHVARAFAENGGTFMTLTQQLDHEAERLSSLKQRYQEARVEMNQELPHKFIVNQAYPSERKAYPKRSIIVMTSTAAAFLFTLLLLIIIDSLQQRIAVTREE